MWENFLTISTDVGDFAGAIRAYEKLIEIHPQKNFTDTPVLAILVRAVTENVADCQGVKARNEFGRLKNLFQKVVAARPSYKEAWGLFADLVLLEQNTEDLKVLSNQATILQKALRAMMADSAWHLEERSRDHLCQIATHLADVGQRYKLQ